MNDTSPCPLLPQTRILLVTSLFSMWYVIHNQVQNEIRGKIPARLVSTSPSTVFFQLD